MKRRRPYGHEPDGTEVLYQQPEPTTFPAYDFDLGSLPLDHQALLDQLAPLYGFAPLALHTLLYSYATTGSDINFNQQPRHKRHKATPAYSMAPPTPAHGLDRSDPDRVSQHGMEPAGSGSNFNESYSLELDGESRLASGLASLKVAMCQTCFTRWDPQNSTCPMWTFRRVSPPWTLSLTCL